MMFPKVKIGISIWPETNAEWLELSLSAIPNITVDLIASQATVSKSDYSLLVIDAESPGPNFLSQQRDLLAKEDRIPIIFLGHTRSPAIQGIDWDNPETTFIPKPYKIEEVRTAVTNQLDALLSAPEEAVAEVPAPVPAPEPIPEKAAPAPEIPPVVPEKYKTQSQSIRPPRHALGYLSTLRLSDLIQMLCLNLWAGKIEIKNLASGEQGCVYLNVGVLIHAECENIPAEPACYRMLAWGRCEFNFIEEHPPVVQSIKTHWQHVLLEGARMIDEEEAAASVG